MTENGVEYIGNARAPVLIFDHFASDPETLIDIASRTDFKVRAPFYPGIRGSSPAEYQRLLIDAVREPIARIFGWTDCAVIESHFSIVTTPPERLVPFQRIPHIDGVNPDELAVLHYLCDARMGGTAFYRHRSTSWEVITPQTLDRYMNTVNEEVRRHGMPEARYVCGDTAMFERIASFDAVFNRALVYRGTSLHSGAIAHDYLPSPDPRVGRLTVNTFLKRVESDSSTA